MTARKLEKEEWGPAFDAVSRELAGYQAEIEVTSLDIGDQVEAEWKPLTGVVYDHKSDVVEIALDNLDHLIRSPREIYLDTDIAGLVGIEIVDAEGRAHIVRFKEPLALPAAE